MKTSDRIAILMTAQDRALQIANNFDPQDYNLASWLEEMLETELNARQFSPFEFIAKGLNDCEDSEDCWQHFDNGLIATFEESWNKATRQGALLN